MKDFYSPNTLEHIRTESGADWMARAGSEPPVYDPQSHSAFFEDGKWVIKAYVPEKFVPSIVSMRQARLALLDAGILDDVQGAVDFGDRATQISWEFATEVRRNDPLVETLAKQLPLSSEEVDNLFVKAATL